MVKLQAKTTSKISLFEIWELIKQAISLSKFVLEVNKDYIYFLFCPFNAKQQKSLAKLIKVL